MRVALLAMFTSLLMLATAPASPAQVLGAGQLAVERRGHSATLLNDGRILVVGGENAAGPTAQSELIDPSSGAVSAGPVSGARTDHAAVLLGDGRVLITGGRDGAGDLGTSEAFDPVANAFIAGPRMARARVGHSATRLTDGRVLVAGGDADGSAEIFDPAAGTFTPLDYHLKAPRAFHGVVRLDDGKVLLAGGALPDGTVLRSAEVFEPSTGSFARISRRMATPRFAPTLVLLPDGKVQVIGGDDATTMEVYTSASRLFNALVHLPPSESLVPATLQSRPRAALFTTAADQNPGLAGSGAEILDLVDREDHTLTEAPGSGRAVVAGGVDKNGQVSDTVTILASSSATVSTEQADYAPGERVTITGSGWQPGETVALLIREEPETHPDVTASAVADAQGRFVNTDFTPGPTDAGRNFTVTAVGQVSGRVAQTVFSDALGFTMEHCQNGTLANLGVPCGTAASPAHPDWDTGDINGSNSEYREADGVPYRLIISNLADGTWTVRLNHRFTKGGVYAYDRLTRYNLTQASDPCLDTTEIACSVGSPAFEFPMPGEVVTPSATEPALPNGGALAVAGSAIPLAAADKRMTVWVEGALIAAFISAGQNYTGVQATSFNDDRVLQNGLATGDSDREFAFKFSLTGCAVAGCVVMLGWTSHLAAAVDWGAGLGAGSISGSPSTWIWSAWTTTKGRRAAAETGR
jgi:hypothetical protein